MLLIGKIEAGKLELHLSPLNINQFCSRLVKEYTSIGGNTCTIEYTLHGNTDTIAMIDGNLLRLILGNLLSNSIKYTPTQKMIRLDVEFIGTNIVFRIADNGVGMTEEEIRLLLQPLSEADVFDNSTDIHIGLMVIKQAVSIHGGTLTVESERVQGTRISVTIPVTITQ